MFFVVAGRPDLSFGLSIIGGVLNMIFDYVLLAVFPLGIAGAAIATGLGYAVQGVAGLFWFTFRRKDILCLVRPKWNGKALLKACRNRPYSADGSLCRLYGIFRGDCSCY